MKINRIVLFVLLFSSLLSAQPEVVWMHMYDVGRLERFQDIYDVAGDGYIMCGFAADEWVARSNAHQTWIVRINDNGEEIWSRQYGQDDQFDIGLSIIETDDGEFLTGGACGDDVAALLVEEDGEQIWYNTYEPGKCSAVIELKSSEFVLAGDSGNDGYLACINSEGDLLWQETFSAGDNNAFYTIREAQGGIVAAGIAIFRDQPRRRCWALKVNFEGEVIWSQIYAPLESQHITSMVSRPEDGFALTGWCAESNRISDHDFLLIAINDEGDLEWWQQYGFGDRFGYSRSFGITKLDHSGYVMVGYYRNGAVIIPTEVRVNSRGVERYFRNYDFHEEDGFAISYHQFNSVIRDEDNNALACGTVNFTEDGSGQNAIVLKLEPEIFEPQFIAWFPEDTLLTVLQGDTMNFWISVHDAQNDDLSILWVFDEDTLDADTSITIIFDELGEHLVQCFVSDGEFSVSIGWHVTVAEWFIRSFAPDSIEIIARRETEVYFTLEIAAIENIELNFLWTLLDRNRRREEVGEVDSVTVCFDLAGEYQLESLVWRGEESDEVNWNIHVRSAVWYWWPQEDSLTVSVDSTLLFAITPFNPDSDSLEYLWTLDGDTIDFEREIEILFEDMGLYEVVAYVHDGCEADTIRWEVSVIPPVSSPIIANELMPTEPVLYPPSPNPFNSSVSLSYFLPQIEHVTLTIYNLGGRKVMSLVNVEQTAGNHTITWNAADQPAGMYLATLQTGDIRRIEKLILIP